MPSLCGQFLQNFTWPAAAAANEKGGVPDVPAPSAGAPTIVMVDSRSGMPATAASCARLCSIGGIAHTKTDYVDRGGSDCIGKSLMVSHLGGSPPCADTNRCSAVSAASIDSRSAWAIWVSGFCAGTEIGLDGAVALLGLSTLQDMSIVIAGDRALRKHGQSEPLPQ